MILLFLILSSCYKILLNDINIQKYENNCYDILKIDDVVVFGSEEIPLIQIDELFVYRCTYMNADCRLYERTNNTFMLVWPEGEHRIKLRMMIYKDDMDSCIRLKKLKDKFKQYDSIIDTGSLLSTNVGIDILPIVMFCVNILLTIIINIPLVCCLIYRNKKD